MFDLILAGGGLANGLLAYRLATQRPNIRLQVIEQEESLGGAHTWSFHATDLTPEQNTWMSPFVVHHWDHYDVTFPTLMRRIEIPYRCVTSARFSEIVAGALGTNLRTGTRLQELRTDGVTLESGEVLKGHAVIDGRGFRRSNHMVNRFQKFVGLEVRLSAPHGLSGPVLMDATVEQSDGYRFIYVLPFTPDAMLIEDTYYADTADIDAACIKDRIRTYAALKGWSIAEVLREEVGVLPITLSGDMAAFWDEDTAGQPRVGLRAGMFHPTTGYSLPGAVKLADLIAAMPVLNSASIHEAVHKIASDGWQRHAFFRLLNRMLFLAGPSQERFRIMQRFYKMPQPLIGRFYGGDLSMFDKMQILTGWPPVSVFGAVKAIMATGR